MLGIFFNPSNHGWFSRRISHGEGPITHIENSIKRFLYIHIADPLIKKKYIFSFKGLRG